MSHDDADNPSQPALPSTEMHAEGSITPMPAERHEMIAVAAYFVAERRGFAPGDAVRDWLEAERQIDGMLAGMRAAGATRADLERVGLRNALRLWNV
jgi:hypothetical protein